MCVAVAVAVAVAVGVCVAVDVAEGVGVGVAVDGLLYFRVAVFDATEISAPRRACTRYA